ncbi:hypothetical protein [Novipirellula artificiosorum]|uniref:Uncharacterized protein n=1 Tax=Novipirellula artificiosorum TaxID=2528016 RepID=A0A5C6DAW6_9BACT|nr:hypothetical protein [Novipirellula artificiosorum]TWU34303.1 hypothetical protein Poly41_44500 [Novipirellula artificiosorum]
MQFGLVSPLGGHFLFTDEIEVFRGPAHLLDQPASTLAVTMQQLYRTLRIRHATHRRLTTDADAVETAIRRAASLARPQQKELLDRVLVIQSQIQELDAAKKLPRNAVLPLNPTHADLYSVQADLWRRQNHSPLSVSVPPTWDPVDPLTPPPDEPVSKIEVHSMRGEFRAAAFNLFNSTAETMDVQLQIAGMPGGTAPSYLTLHEVQWTDTSESQPVAAALPLAKRSADGWTVSVLPGLVRQVWLTFHVTDLPAGTYQGRVEVRGSENPSQTIPLELRVWPVEFPTQTTLLVGGWDYSDDDAHFGMTTKNRQAFLRHLQARFVNAPWATATVLRSFTIDPNDRKKITLDTAQMDKWIDRWPPAKAYMVFLSVADYTGAIRASMGNTEMGSADFNQSVATWISAWVRHLRGKGISPDQLAILILTATIVCRHGVLGKKEQRGLFSGRSVTTAMHQVGMSTWLPAVRTRRSLSTTRTLQRGSKWKRSARAPKTTSTWPCSANALTKRLMMVVKTKSWSTRRGFSPRRHVTCSMQRTLTDFVGMNPKIAASPIAFAWNYSRRSAPSE